MQATRYEAFQRRRFAKRRSSAAAVPEWFWRQPTRSTCIIKSAEAKLKPVLHAMAAKSVIECAYELYHKGDAEGFAALLTEDCQVRGQPAAGPLLASGICSCARLNKHVCADDGPRRHLCVLVGRPLGGQGGGDAQSTRRLS